MLTESSKSNPVIRVGRSGQTHAMRLVAWNCCEKFDTNLRHLRELEFDVAVVSECGPTAWDDEVTGHIVRPVGDLNGNKHLGVFARAPWSITPTDIGAHFPWCLAARVDGPRSFTLLAVWTQSPGTLAGRPAYTEQVRRLIEAVVPQIPGDVVVAGDFNAPGNDPTSTRRHRANVDTLLGLGLVSAFTVAHGVDAVAGIPTYFHQWKAAQPFHIDHVFVPLHWTKDLEVTVGLYDDWVAAGRSDHVPVLVDFGATR